MFINYKSDLIMSCFRILLVLLAFSATAAQGASYRKATEGNQNIKGKLVTKKGRIELGVDGGLILNQAYVNTFLIHGSLTYYSSELWGFSLEGAFGVNSDKSERDCIENFYNNPQELTGPPCGSEADIPEKGNFGPAYVPIREIQYIISGNGVWNPIYGKQLIFLSAVVHFDMFFTIGGGIAASNYYAKAQNTRIDGGGGGRATRIPPDGVKGGESANDANYGCEPSFEGCYGVDGRPDQEQQTTPIINLGIGQKLHFGNLFNFKFELRNMTLLGTESGFENLFALWGGVGLRF